MLFVAPEVGHALHIPTARSTETDSKDVREDAQESLMRVLYDKCGSACIEAVANLCIAQTPNVHRLFLDKVWNTAKASQTMRANKTVEAKHTLDDPLFSLAAIAKEQVKRNS